MKPKSADLFGKLQPEKPEDKKQIIIPRNPRLDSLLGDYTTYRFDVFEHKDECEGGKTLYERADCAYSCSPTPEDIQLFMIHKEPKLKQPEQEYLGIFVSMLINRCDEDELTLAVTRPWNSLGTRFGRGYVKKLTINGSLEDMCGAYMESGIIEVTGSVRNFLGHRMRGGSIIVHGNAGTAVAEQSKGGAIHIKGSYYAKGGKAKVYGTSTKKR